MSNMRTRFQYLQSFYIAFQSLHPQRKSSADQANNFTKKSRRSVNKKFNPQQIL